MIAKTRSNRFWIAALLTSASLPSSAAVVFSALIEGMWTVHYQETIDSPPRQVRPDGVSGDQTAPRLSPDGKTVAFEVTGEGIYSCSLAQNRQCSKVTHGSHATRPAWQAATGELVFTGFDFSAEQETANFHITTNGRKNTDVLLHQTGIQDYPDVSPDGRRVAYTSSQTLTPLRGTYQVIQQLWLLTPGNGAVEQLIPGNRQDMQPRWSPDGKQLAFASNRNGQFDIWTVSDDGSDLKRLTNQPESETWPAWSPDGQMLLYTRIANARHELWLIDKDGSNTRPHQPFGKDLPIQIRDPDWR